MSTVTEMPWSMVMPGMIVLAVGDIPRRVEYADTVLYHGRRVMFLEGLTAPLLVEPTAPVGVVTLGEADAVATLAAAGLNPEIIELSEQEQ